MTYVIAQSCCNDASCVSVCPVDCIHPTPGHPDFGSAEMLYINPDDCIECGACVEACPAGAVHLDAELPDHLTAYEQINADYFTWLGAPPERVPAPRPGPKAEQDGPLRVAVVGSGPSGVFLAEELLRTRRADVEITMLDRLVTPYGLVRNGVAPDHLLTKQTAGTLAATLGSRKVILRLGVEVGRDVDHDDLLAHHHAVVYAIGAAEGRTLGLDGESLPGSYSAAELVGWYNGHPDHTDLDPPLDTGRAVIVGNGNVALDMARLLLADRAALEASDMAPHAVEALAKAPIEEVVLLARRGARHAAFTTPELLALIQDDDLDVVADPGELGDLTVAEDGTTEGFAAAQKAALLRGLPATSAPGRRRIVLRFGVRPERLLGDDRVEGVEIVAADGSGTERIETGLVLRATGYRTVPAPGAPVDRDRGRFVHESGRVLDPDEPGNGPVPGVFTVGWAKRGPSGVIGTNRVCAAETAQSLLDDYVTGALPAPRGEDLDVLLTERGVPLVGVAEWRALDRHELAAGQSAGRPRLKVVRRDEQLSIATGEQSA